MKLVKCLDKKGSEFQYVCTTTIRNWKLKLHISFLTIQGCQVMTRFSWRYGFCESVFYNYNKLYRLRKESKLINNFQNEVLKKGYFRISFKETALEPYDVFFHFQLYFCNQLIFDIYNILLDNDWPSFSKSLNIGKVEV